MQKHDCTHITHITRNTGRRAWRLVARRAYIFINKEQ